MQTTIVVRHSEIADGLRQRAITVVERLGNMAARPMEMTIVFDPDGLDRTVELRLHLAKGEILVATGEGADHRTALDRAEEKLRRQVERASGRPRRARSARSEHPL
jgi:ribosome-associated translation inhibitor RaiA